MLENNFSHIKIDHIGYFVEDLNVARAFLSGLPGIGNWSETRYDSWGKHELSIGEPYTIAITHAQTSLGCDIEIIQPIHEISIGSYFDEYVLKHGSGLHHIAYSFNDQKLLQKFVEKLIMEGGTIVHAGCGPVEMTPGIIQTFEVIYLQPGDDEIVLEIIGCYDSDKPEK